MNYKTQRLKHCQTKDMHSNTKHNKGKLCNSRSKDVNISSDHQENRFHSGECETDLPNNTYHPTLHELYLLQQHKCKDDIGNILLFPYVNEKETITSCETDTISSSISTSNLVTLSELCELQHYKWKNKKTEDAMKKLIASSYNKETISDSTIYTNGHLTLCELYQKQGYEYNSKTRKPAQQQFVPNVNNKDIYVQLRKNILSRVPQWIKLNWMKASENQDHVETSEANCSEKLHKEEEHLAGNIQEKGKNFDLDTESCTGQNKDVASALNVKDTCLCENVAQKHPVLQEWEEWSVKLLKDGQLCITGKCDGIISVSKDVSHWERVDAHTLRNPENSIIFKLVGVPDHCIGADFPSLVHKKFQNGFPEDWLEVQKLWNDLQHKERTESSYVVEKRKQRESWLESSNSSDSHMLNEANVSSREPSIINSSTMKRKQRVKMCPVRAHKHLGGVRHSSAKVDQRRDGFLQHVQQQQKLNAGNAKILNTTASVKKTTPEVQYTVTFRTVPDIPSSFDETDASFRSQ